MTTERAVVTLAPATADAARRLAVTLGEDVRLVDVVRRGLILLDLLTSLNDDEELVIRRKSSGECDRLRFSWDTFPERR